jgi:hypothetical protein
MTAPVSVSSEDRHTRLFWLIALAIPLAFTELFGFAATRLAPALFDQRDAVLATLTPDAFAQFRALVASPVLGWDNPAGTTRHAANCGHVDIAYTYDADRLRVHGRTTLRDAVVLVAGDSFTQGGEVPDSDTFPAALERMLGVPVANLGVGGYGPDQALIKLEGSIDRAPRARVLVLAIMYEDVIRMLNSYRPVVFSRTGIRFGFKPYLRNGAFVPLADRDPFRDFPAMRAAADDAFDDDFWARPRPRFPYTAALVRAALAPANWYPALQRVTGWLGWPRDRLLYSLPPVRRGLSGVYGRFARLVETRKLTGVVAFIPQEFADHTSGEIALRAATDAQRRAIRFLNVGAGIDWAHFIGPTCHPNADGYRMIADEVARAVRPLLAL